MKKKTNLIWLIVAIPFIFISAIVTVILTATSMDRTIASLVESSIASAEGKTNFASPSKHDKSIKLVIEKFMMLPEEEASFDHHVNWKGATPTGLAPWLTRFKDGLDAIKRNFPPDASSLLSELSKADEPLMNHRPAITMVEKIVGRILVLIKLDARLGNAKWYETFFSLVHFVTVIQRGTGGKVNKRDLIEGEKLLSRCYGEIFPLIKEGLVTPSMVPVFSRKITDFDSIALTEKVLFRDDEKDMRTIFLDVKTKLSWKWFLPRLAFIGDPLLSLSDIKNEICGACDMPPVIGSKMLKDIGQKYRESLTTPLIIGTLYGKKSAIFEMDEIYTGLARGRTVIGAFKVLLLVINYLSVNNRLPDSLNEIESYKKSPVIDALTGNEFVYRVKNGSFFLYSPGLDNKDDGGNPVSDVVFISAR